MGIWLPRNGQSGIGLECTNKIPRFLSVQANTTNTRSKRQSDKAVSKIMGGVAVVWCKVMREREPLCVFLSFPLDAGGKY